MAEPPLLGSDHGIVFDRRLPSTLVAALAGGGPLEGLADLVRRSPPDRAVDLGCRGDVTSRRSPSERPRSGRVTLYVGTTRACHVHMRRDGRVRVERQEGVQLADRGRLRVPFDEAWGRWHHPEDLGRSWSRILEHLDEVVEMTPAGRRKEGAIQAALGRLGRDCVIVDREVVLSHRENRQRDLVRQALRRWVEAVCEAGDGELPPSRPKSFGNKLDALGLDSDGRLLIIEVKPATELNGTAWTPLQVAVYHQLFRAWLEDAGDHAVTVVQGMLDDRSALGLAASDRAAPARLQPDLAPRPVVALGAATHARLDLLQARFRAVLKACRSVEPALHDLVVWSVSDGSVEPHPHLP